MNSILVSWAISSLMVFVDASIKNPTSAKAQALKSRLIELRDNLNVLIAKLGG